MHNGFLNTYSSKGGKNIILVPLSLSELHKNKPQKWPEHSDLLLTFGEPLLKASYHEFKAFKEWILNVQEELDAPLSSHPIAIFLITYFCHLFPEEIPMVYLLKEISSTTLILLQVLSFQTS